MSVFKRLGKTLNWLFLSVNSLLFIILLHIWFSSFNNTSSQATKDAKGMGLDVYCEKTPFEILVDKKYSQNGNYYFCQYGNPIIFLNVLDDTTSETGAKKRATFNLGTNFTIDCPYSIENGECHVYEMDLRKDGEGFADLNVDGLFDAHVKYWPREETRVDVWYKGKWSEVDRKKSEGMGKYQKVLKENGEVVIFDKDIGQWIPKNDNHEPKSEAVKP